MNKYIKKLDMKSLFLLTFILGMLVMGIGTFQNLPLVSLVLVVILMISYFIIGSKINKITSIEQFADSNYFLGFLFTLTSLCLSLLTLGVMDEPLNILIHQFGIAVITTIIGLLIRILIINFVPNEDSNREAFNLIVAEKMQLINDQISETIDKNIVFSDLVDEKINVFAYQIEKNITSFTNDLTEKLDIDIIKSSVERISFEMNDIYEEQSKSLVSIKKDIENSHKKYISNFEEVSESFDLNFKTIKEFNLFVLDMKSNLNIYTDEIKKVTDNNMKMFTELTESFNLNSKDVHSEIETLNNLIKNLSSNSLDIHNENKLLLENKFSSLNLKNMEKNVENLSTNILNTHNENKLLLEDKLSQLDLNEIKNEIKKLEFRSNLEEITSKLEKSVALIDNIKLNTNFIEHKKINDNE